MRSPLNVAPSPVDVLPRVGAFYIAWRLMTNLFFTAASDVRCGTLLGRVVAELLALPARELGSNRSVAGPAVGGYHLPVADEVDRRIEPGVGAARVLVVDHCAHRPSELEVTDNGVLLVHLGRPRLVVDDRGGGIGQAGSNVIADDVLIVVGFGTVVHRLPLLLGGWAGIAAAEHHGQRGQHY